MYRIRLTTGEEAVFKTVEELAQAVASGVVSPDSEVFHKGGNRWLPVNTHPDYRTLTTRKYPALARSSAPHPIPVEPEPLAVEHRPTPRTTPAVQAPLPVTAEVYRVEPVVEQHFQADAEAPPAMPGALDAEESAPDYLPRYAYRKRTIRPAVAAAFGLAALLLIAAGVVLASRLGGRPVGAAPSEAVEDMPPAPAPAPAPAPVDPGPLEVAEDPPVRLARPDTVSVEYASPSKPLPPSTAQPAPEPPAPPKVVSRLGTSVTRMPSYFEAYADARAEMDEGLNYVNFRRVFAPSRFASLDSLRVTRRIVAAAGNILRVYRSREVMLEQTYRPGEPDGHGSLREPFEVAEASRRLLADVDSLLALLVAQEGEVRYRDGAMEFRNRGAARAYTDVRRRIIRVLAGLGDIPEAADRVTMPRLIRAIGSDRPPPAR